MKKILLLLCGILLVFGGATTALATSVMVTYTADNIVGAWYQDGSAPSSLGLGSNASNWELSDTEELNLAPGSEYQIVWRVRNLEYPADANHPAGFLAQIDLGSSLIQSSSNWQVSHIDPTSDQLANFDLASWDWHSATTYGTNDPTDTNIWHTIAGIAYGAEWLWDGANYGNATTPFYQEIFVRATFETAPVSEPASMLLLGCGLVGLATVGRRKFRRS